MPTHKTSTLPHLQWLVRKKKQLQTKNGRPIQVFELQHKPDGSVLSAWAKHFRNHYCDDAQLDALRDGTGLTRAEYLRHIKFPDPKNKPGPSVRSGDFSEILVADYVEYVLKYWVPRTRYDNKVARNESTKGTDILGFKVTEPGKYHAADALVLVEVKAALTLADKPNVRLHEAIKDSAKDELRKAESLNALKQRCLRLVKTPEVKTIERFQNPEDHPYTESYGAVAVVCCADLDATHVSHVDSSAHPNAEDLTLIVIHGLDMMALVHELYKRAADEA